MLNWNDLHFFFGLQRSGRLLTAARRFDATHATVAQYVENIECDPDTRLFAQHTGGHQLTPADQALLEHAGAMENTALLAQGEMSQNIPPLRQIRINVTKDFGSVFLAPRLAQLICHYPDLEVELVSAPRFVSATNHETDITVPLGQLSADLVITRLLTRYRLALFVSPAYPGQASPLRDRDNLGRHQWIDYVDDLLFNQKLMFHHSFCRHPQVIFHSTSVVTRQRTAQTGIDLAILPHFIGSYDPLLVPVLSEESIQHGYWTSTRRELHHSVRLRVVWDFLLELYQRERGALLGPSATPPL